VEEPSEDEAEQAQGQLEELWVQSKSKRPARYVGNSERSKHQRRQKQRKAAVGTKKLTSFFGKAAEVAVKKYRSRRRISRAMLENID
jgi:hypothetical protein